MADTRNLPVTSTDSWDWQLHAACRSLPESVFFHPDGERGEQRADRERRAKAICADCPVRTRCLSHALQAREPYGVWGGLSETERHRLLVRSGGREALDDIPTPRHGAAPSTSHTQR